MKIPEPGLYRTTKPYPGHEQAIPASALIYVGQQEKSGAPFLVRPGQNRRNRWFWGEPTIPFRALSYVDSLKKLPSEGFYTLPYDLPLEGGGRWLKNAIVQLGYNGEGKGILFVAEDHQNETRNVLVFSDRGMLISDELLGKLIWAPILPVSANP